MNRKRNLPFTWIEVAIVILILFTIARFFWAKEFRELEIDFFKSLGFSKTQIYMLSIPIVFFMCVNGFKKEKQIANNKGVPVVRKSILIFSTIAILSVVLFLIHLASRNGL